MKNLQICIFLFMLTFAVAFAGATDAKPKRKNTSGIYGTVMAYNTTAAGETQSYNNDGYVPNCEVVIKCERDKKVVARVRANQYGKFTVTVHPGKYIIVPVYPPKMALGSIKENNVTVWKGYYSFAEALFDGGW